MDFSSEMVCRVVLPSSLPTLDNMAKIEGSVLLHSAELSDRGITLEGDLLWQVFFPDDSGALQCLWEGAEFFRETFTTEGMKRGDDFTISPLVRSVSGEVKDDDSRELRFQVHWWDYRSIDVDAAEQKTCLWEDETSVPPIPEKIAEVSEMEAVSSKIRKDETMTIRINRCNKEKRNPMQMILKRKLRLLTILFVKPLRY